MKTYLASILFSFLLSILLIPVFCRIGRRLRIYGNSCERNIPRLGGIPIFLSFILPLIALFFYNNQVSDLLLEKPELYGGFLLGAVLIVILGTWDDFKNISAGVKLLFQIAIASLTYFCGFHFSSIMIPVLGIIDLGVWTYPITVLWTVGLMNAMNLIDGIDGLASGISLFACVTIAIVAHTNEHVVTILLCCALIGALIGFIRFNFYPARIYLGDSGSLFLGYVLAIISIWGEQKSTTFIALMTVVIALGIPVLDMMVTISRRYFNSIPIFQRDAGHIHHRLASLGLSQRKAVLVLYGICIVLNMMALMLFFSRNAIVILFPLIFGAIFGLRYLNYFNLDSFRNRYIEYQRIRVERYYRFVINNWVLRAQDRMFPDNIWFMVEGVSRELKLTYLHLSISKIEKNDIFNNCLDRSYGILNEGEIVLTFAMLLKDGALEIRIDMGSGRDITSKANGTPNAFLLAELLFKEMASLAESFRGKPLNLTSA